MNIDIIIVVSFLLLTLAVGLSHGQKVKTLKDYALGGRNFSTGALIATIVATIQVAVVFLLPYLKPTQMAFIIYLLLRLD